MTKLTYAYIAAVNAAHRAMLRRLARDESAVSVIEYAILLGVIVGAVTLAVTQFGDTISTTIQDIASRVSTTVTNVGST